MRLLDEEQIAKLSAELASRRMTLKQIMTKYKVSRRSAFRWLRLLEQRGFVIERTGYDPTYYKGRKTA